VHLVGFIIRIYHDAARSAERQTILKFTCLCFNNVSIMIIFERSKYIAALLACKYIYDLRCNSALLKTEIFFFTKASILAPDCSRLLL